METQAVSAPKRTKVSALLASPPSETTVLAKGWVRNRRQSKAVAFIALNDGSTINNVQVVADLEKIDEAVIAKANTGACLAVRGKLVASQGSGQAVELQAETIEVLGESPAEEYPLQPKKHSLEFLREKAHLRPRTSTIGSVMRIRHGLSYAVHTFFHERGFFHMHTPIITASDAEGAGETFRVTTLPPDGAPKTEDGAIDYKEDFFGKEANLTVSGQLEAEAGALALGEVYTFGPTFRAENSNTARHLAEFWMIEPEMAFYDLNDLADLAEDFSKYLIRYALEHYADELAFLDKRAAEEDKAKPQNERSEMGLLERLQFVVENPFERLTYTEAIDVLLQSKPHKKKKFKFPVEWGVDLQSEHERYLVEKHYKRPVILTDYPAKIKAFYMRGNDDGQTVRAMDVLFPGIGEIIGGSQREERLDKLLARMEEMNVPQHDLWWFLELRKFGTCEHSGFGMGFERMVQFVTGMGNIRDVIPFPRFPQHVEF